MNILLICATDIWSIGEGMGAPTIYRTLKAFNDAGHAVHVVLPERAGDRGVSSGDVEGLDRVRFTGLPHLKSPSRSRPSQKFISRAWSKLQLAILFPLLAAWEGRQILKQEKIDVLYGYEVHGVLAVSLLRRLKPIPSVARFQGSVLDPTPQNPFSSARKIDHVIALKSSADLYIMTDDGTLGDVTLTRLNPLSKRRLRYWRNGIDLARFRPASSEEAALARNNLGIPKDAPVVLAVSRLAWWKRLDRAIRAWPQVIAQRSDAMLVLVGDGEQRPRLEEMTRLLGVQGSVHFAGAVQQERVVNYLRAADIFVSVNELSNAGNPLMEALACGKAIVTLNNGSTGKLIADGVTGILLKPDDDTALSGAIARLIEDQPLRERLQQQARQFATDNFWTWEERMAAEVQAVSELVSLQAGKLEP